MLPFDLEISLRVLSYRVGNVMGSERLQQSSLLPRLWKSLGDFIYPPHCLICHGDLAEPAEKTPYVRSVCVECSVKLSGVAGPVCERCCAPVGPNLNTEAGCVHCQQDKFGFCRVLALGPYSDELRRVCLTAKQRAMVSIAGGLAELVWERWQEVLQEWRVDVVVPVPRHWYSRLWSAEAAPDVLAARLSDLLLCPLGRHILRKMRWTSAQSSLKPNERRRNLRKAFRTVRGVRLDGCRVLLVDDVLTTGTTADQATRALIQAGAAEVMVAVAARGIGLADGPM